MNSVRTLFNSRKVAYPLKDGLRVMTYQNSPENRKRPWETTKSALSVTKKYDRIFDIVTMGVHRIWRNRFVTAINPTVDLKCIDVAGGTGGIAFKIHEYARRRVIVNLNNNQNNSGPSITVCDVNPAMIEFGKMRAAQLGIGNMEWVQCTAEHLPFEDETFDLYTIGFGLRFCSDINTVLSEAYRVLRPNGRFYCLESGHMQSGLFKLLVNLYFTTAIKLAVRDKALAQELMETRQRFPK
ncbi:unnamed protein product [Calicophoron daubneyi]|uniref:2-methoxy-6-polyprenyl-1,4-benzoquinol methylase, mitochondrial n=1 Tax=Calicophoron daubneyi TaxID=300641 RepID=A0AAV2TP02_CALDB